MKLKSPLFQNDSKARREVDTKIFNRRLGGTTLLKNISINLPQIGREDAQFVAVFGDGAAGDGDAFGGEHLHDFLVGQRAARILILENVGNHVLDAGVGNVVAVGVLQAGGEKVFHLEHALLRFDIFAGDGAADGGFMHADDFGDLRHGHGLEMRDALVHELALALDDFAPDVGDGGLALVQALDEKFAGADFFADVILHLGVVLAAGHQILIDIADAQVRNLLVVGGDGEIVAVLHHENLGCNVLLDDRQKGASGSRFQLANAGERFLDLLHGLAGAARDFGNAPFAERVHEVADDAIFQRLLLAGAFELEHQTFAQIARPDADGFKCLNDLEDFGNFFGRQAGGSRQFLDRRTEIAVVVNVAEEQLGDALPFVVQFRIAHLFDEMLRERNLCRDRIEHELPFFLVLGGGADGRVRLR